MGNEPSDEDLRAFVGAMLANFDRHLLAPEVIEETIRDHQAMWVLLYHASLGFDVPDS